MADRVNIKVSKETFDVMTGMKGGRTWDSFLADLAEGSNAVQEQQADALELIAGMLMLEFDSREGRPSYSVEALEREARFHARGGESV